MISHHAKPDADTLLQVAEGLDVILLSDNEVLIQFGSRSRPSELLRDGDLSGLLGRVMGLILERPATRRELLSRAPSGQERDAVTLLDDLLSRGILAAVSTSPIDQYLRYTFAGESPLSSQRIAVLGAGPLGAGIAANLARHGVAAVSVLDERPIDNSWRAFMPGRLVHDGVFAGRADEVLCTCFSLPIDALPGKLDAEGIESATGAADLVVVALEKPDLRVSHLVNRFAIRERKPWLLVTIDGNFGIVGPLFVPVETACYNDYRTLAFAATPNRGMARKHREHLLRDQGHGTFFAGLPSYVEIVTGHASLAALHFLLRGTCFALGRVMMIDFDRMQIDVEDVLKLPRCPVCGSERPAYRPIVPGPR